MHLLEDQALSGLSGDEWIPELEVTLLFPTFGGPGATLPWMQTPRNPTEGAPRLCSGRVPVWFLQAQQDSLTLWEGGGWAGKSWFHRLLVFLKEVLQEGKG